MGSYHFIWAKKIQVSKLQLAIIWIRNIPLLLRSLFLRICPISKLKH